MDAAPAIPAPPGLLSAAEESLIEALARPGADLASLAAAHALSLSALARWLGLPHVRRAFDAVREVVEIERRRWQEQQTRDAIETLNEVMKSSDAPVERRRAASAILRTFTTLFPRRAHQPRSSSSSPTSPFPPRAPAFSPFPARAPREATEGRATTSTPSPPQDSTPTPQDSAQDSRLTPQDSPTPSSSPDPTADLALALLRDANPPDARAAIVALDPLLDDDPITPAQARTTIDGLLALIAALHTAEISSEPATLISDHQAVKVYTLTPRANQLDDPSTDDSAAPAQRIAMTLGRARAGDWRFHALTRLDTS